MNLATTHAKNMPPSAPSLPNANAAAPQSQQMWHVLSPQDALTASNTPDSGLPHKEVTERQEKYGKNELPRAKPKSVFNLLWRQINNPLIWVLVASALVAIVADPLHGVKDGLVIIAVVTLNTLIGFVQEFKAGKAIQALSQMVPEHTMVLREGKRTRVPAAELVPGDLVWVASGDKVPADMRLVHVKNLQIEEAPLTGESIPVEKSTDAVSESAGIEDRRCMAYAGTMVTYGTATGLITGIGAATELGKISAMLRETTDLETPLTKALHQIGRIITIAIIVIVFQIFYLLNCRSLRDSLRSIGVFTNPSVFLGTGSLVALHLFFIYSPPLQAVFSTAPLSLRDLVFATAVGAVVIPVVSIEKRWRAHAEQRDHLS